MPSDKDTNQTKPGTQSGPGQNRPGQGAGGTASPGASGMGSGASRTSSNPTLSGASGAGSSKGTGTGAAGINPGGMKPVAGTRPVGAGPASGRASGSAASGAKSAGLKGSGVKTPGVRVAGGTTRSLGTSAARAAAGGNGGGSGGASGRAGARSGGASGRGDMSADTLRRAARAAYADTASRVRDYAGDARDRAGTFASSMVRLAEGAIEDRKRHHAETVRGISSAIDHAADEMEEHSPEAARYVREAASGIERVSRTLEDTSLSEMMDYAGDFARRQPVAVFAGALVAGLALARFARSAEEPSRSRSRFGGSGGRMDHDDMDDGLEDMMDEAMGGSDSVHGRRSAPGPARASGRSQGGASQGGAHAKRHV